MMRLVYFENKSFGDECEMVIPCS